MICSVSCRFFLYMKCFCVAAALQVVCGLFAVVSVLLPVEKISLRGKKVLVKPTALLTC